MGSHPTHYSFPHPSNALIVLIYQPQMSIECLGSWIAPEIKSHTKYLDLLEGTKKRPEMIPDHSERPIECPGLPTKS